MSTIQSCFKRYEKKYLLTHEQYQAMLRGMAYHMQPDEHPRYTIGNVYYDTPDFALIRASLEKPIYKEKLRMRSYGVPDDDGTVFVELKKKFDGVVYKRRVTMREAYAVRWLDGAQPPRERSPREEVSCSADSAFVRSQIGREIEFFLQSYRPTPAVYIAYDREAYAGREQSELRVTFDTNLRARAHAVDLRDGDRGGLILPAEDILMEIKIPGAAPLWLARLLSENQIVSTSFSKYGAWYKQAILSHDQPVKQHQEVLSIA